MGQQPNIELEPSDRPREVPEPAPPRLGPDARPGVITAPDQVPSGASFGRPGPDTGWAYRIIQVADLPDRTPDLEAVLVAIMAARASSFGRAPVPEDLEVARMLLGLGGGRPDLDERRERWLEATAHEKVKGTTALAEIDRDVLRLRPEQIRSSLGR